MMLEDLRANDRRHLDVFVCILLLSALLIALAVAAFWPVLRNGFINYDDPDYVTQTPQVLAGLTWRGLAWAFTTGWAGNWHPLTWASHMLDVTLFGVSPGAHHAVNLLLHVTNTLLLFFLLKRLTGSLWRSALVAGLFAVHPMHVQTVAWVSERKDLLSAFFGFLTIWAYANYAAKAPHARRSTLDVLPPYLLSLALFALGLMSKPMLVTLPFVLLLLDFWPLQRLQPSLRSVSPRILIEKLPFLALSAISSFVTLRVQQAGGAVATLNALPLSARLANALVSYCRYLGKLFWPADLTVFYPQPANWALWQVAAAAALLLAISIAVLFGTRRFPFLATGWFWFLGMLIPVIGIVQVGAQSMADRYSYLPFVGLFIALTWLTAEMASQHAIPRKLTFALGFMLLAACAMASNVQTRYWKDTLTLFQHALSVTPDNSVARFSLGKALAEQGKLNEASYELQRALQIDPGFAKAQGQLASVLADEGRCAEAIHHYELALQSDPNVPEALNNLAWLRATSPDPKLQNGTEAVRLAQRACQLTDYQRTVFIGTLAAAYAEAGQFDAAVATAQMACDHAQLWHESELAQKNKDLLELYRAGKPYRTQ
ncbi:MAG TPA: hypothetical protein VG146_10255 [Verrucomicrobiae bacterium]|nr:hypothetical protein [Verrucomicrobiae bacterium]